MNIRDMARMTLTLFAPLLFAPLVTAQEADDMFTLIRKIRVDPLGVVGQIDGCEFSWDNKFIIASDNHGIAHVYLRETGEEIGSVKHIEISNKKFERAGKVNAVGYSHNGKWLYTGINDVGTKVWDAHTFKLLHHLSDGKDTDGAAFTRDDSIFVVAASSEVHVYSVPGFKRIHSYKHKKGNVNTVDFNPDDSLMISTASKGEVFLLRTSDWKIIRRHQFKSSAKRGYFSPDGTLYVLSGRDQFCNVYRTSDGRLEAELKHRGNLKMLPGDDYGDKNPAIECVRWSHQGRFLFTGGVVDGIMRVWRTEDWSLIGYVQAQKANRQIEYIHVSTSNEVIVGGDEGVMYHYAFTPPMLMKPFAQSGDGLICLEAEGFDTSLPQGGHRWKALSEPGAAGEKSLQALPNKGTDRNKKFARYDPLKDSPKLDYRVTFGQERTYHVWVRAKGGDADNSLHVGLDGKAVSSADKITFPASESGYVWSRATADDKSATISIPSKGLHTINVWMAEDGTTLDRILLTPDGDYDPSGVNGGNGPESNSR